jgi:hypothetical protein
MHSDRKAFLDDRIIWREQNAAIGLNGQHPITHLDMKAVRHVLGDRGAD